MTYPIKINDPMKVDQNGKSEEESCCCFSFWKGRSIAKKDSQIPKSHPLNHEKLKNGIHLQEK